MDSQDRDHADQPRQPRNMQDVLRYAIEARNDAEQPSSPEPVPSMDPERRRFLEEAINNLSVNVVKTLSEAIETLKSLNKDIIDPEPYENALDVIADYVDNIDAANDFVKLGGFTIVENCLQSQHPGVRWRIADIIALCTQNNPFCQNHALKSKLHEPLIVLADKDPDEKCKTKAFYAMSNVVRDSKIGLREFMRRNGFSVVMKAMKSDSERLKLKAVFFFDAVITDHSNVIWDVVSMGFTELLISLLQGELSPSHEFMASSLLVLAKKSKEALTTCKKTDLKLEGTLKRIVDAYSTDESYEELVASANELLKLIR